MFRAYKFELLPNSEQLDWLQQCGGGTRWVWNYMLDLNEKTYKETGKFVFNQNMSALLPKLKQEYKWLSIIPAQALQQKCRDLDKSLKLVWKQGNGFPKFKSKHQEQDSFRISQIQNLKHITKKQIKIPKIGWVKWNKYRNLEGKLKNITVKQEDQKWWVVCLCELPDPIKKTEITSLVGVDMGLKEFAVTSDNKIYKTQKFYRKQQAKLKRAQRVLSRREKGSNNRLKARARVALIHKKIRNQRQDFTHKVSTQITKEYDFIAIEDLNIKGMQKNRRLAKAISDQGWAMFLGQLDYKSKANGGKTVKIDRFAPSTKTCSNCGEKHNMPLNIRLMDCKCGFVMDRDLNAAINIRRWGKDILTNEGYSVYNKENKVDKAFIEPSEKSLNACGDTNNRDQSSDLSSYVSMKQEKDCRLDKKLINICQ